MALCPGCRRVIPCHCHLTPPTQIRYGMYLTTELPSPREQGAHHVRALTVKYPWSAAIAHGPKRIENRSKPIPAKHLGTTILIHAGAAEDENALPADMVRAWPRHFRAVVAVATLASCHQDNGCCRPWGFPGQWHWVLENVRAVPHPPRPVRGQLGLWTVDDDVLAAVQRQVYIPQEVNA